MRRARVVVGDALRALCGMPDRSVHCVVTSPPYWGLRDYGTEGQLGLERSPAEYVQKLVILFSEVRRVLRDDGTLWLNLGDSYAGVGAQTGGTGSMESGRRAERMFRSGIEWGAVNLKRKELCGIPWRVALALQDDGWWLRSDCIWHKPNPMPESVTDRPTKAHEYVFLFAKRGRYFYDPVAVRTPYAHLTREQRGRPYGGVATKDYRDGVQTPGDVKRRVLESLERNGGANLKSVWTIATQPFAGAHFATFPEELAGTCVAAGTSLEGCCAKCGAPFVRVVERRGSTPKRVGKSAEKVKAGLATAFSGYEDGSKAPSYETLGWRRTCRHRGAPVPCTVLDPFAGAGTTGVVALRMGRAFVGVELNPEYAKLAARRIRDDAPLLNRVESVSIPAA